MVLPRLSVLSLKYSGTTTEFYEVLILQAALLDHPHPLLFLDNSHIERLGGRHQRPHFNSAPLVGQRQLFTWIPLEAF